MKYEDFDYATDADSAPWSAAPSPMIARGDAQLYPLSPNPVVVNTTNPPSSEMLVLGSMLQTMQRAQTQQMYILREMDSRLARLEHDARSAPRAQGAAFERATWWAIWGLLMLILGGALVVVIMLILMNIELR